MGKPSFFSSEDPEQLQRSMRDIFNLFNGRIDKDNFGLKLEYWEPSYSANGSMTYTDVTTNYAVYIDLGLVVYVAISANGTTGGTGASQLYVTLPGFRGLLPTAPIVALVSDGGTIAGTAHVDQSVDTERLAIRRYDGGTFGIGASRKFRTAGFLIKDTGEDGSFSEA